MESEKKRYAYLEDSFSKVTGNCRSIFLVFLVTSVTKPNFIRAQLFFAISPLISTVLNQLPMDFRSQNPSVVDWMTFWRFALAIFCCIFSVQAFPWIRSWKGPEKIPEGINVNLNPYHILQQKVPFFTYHLHFVICIFITWLSSSYDIDKSNWGPFVGEWVGGKNSNSGDNDLISRRSVSWNERC